MFENPDSGLSDLIEIVR